jgi:hypothetical protein
MDAHYASYDINPSISPVRDASAKQHKGYEQAMPCDYAEQTRVAYLIKQVSLMAEVLPGCCFD